jgi:predicted alpha/beta-hydrolase family hydrolase
MREIETPRGIARIHEHTAAAPAARLVLGHGAGGSITAPDLQAVTKAAVAANVSVVLVEQPYRVLGRKSAPPAPHLDEAWIAACAALGDELPLICGGRSSGARVACRTAAAVGAIGVVCLAFPLITPKGVSRQDELDAVSVPLLIVQGRNDRFGVPDGAVVVDGDHGLKKELSKVAAAVTEWIARLPRAT